jgi:hypothetical protein
MNAAASPFALVAEFLQEFLIALWFGGTKPHAVNAGLSNEHGDGALDLASQALSAADGTTALLHLEQAADMASTPTGFEVAPHELPHPAVLERKRMALAARVALALTREAMRQPAPRIAWHEPPAGEELLIFTLEDTQGDAPQDEALEPLELPEDFRLSLELLALPAPVPLPSAAADLTPSPQG